MQPGTSRRAAICGLFSIAGVAGIAVVAGKAGAASAPVPLPHLKRSDPLAEAVAYQEDARLVDPASAPDYRRGQTCANCAAIAGAATDLWRPCALIPGFAVSAAGWCQMYSRKP